MVAGIMAIPTVTKDRRRYGFHRATAEDEINFTPERSIGILCRMVLAFECVRGEPRILGSMNSSIGIYPIACFEILDGWIIDRGIHVATEQLRKIGRKRGGSLNNHGRSLLAGLLTFVIEVRVPITKLFSGTAFLQVHPVCQARVGRIPGLGKRNVRRFREPKSTS